MEKHIIELHACALEGRGDEEFCRYNELFQGWWSGASGCFKGQRRLDFSGVRSQSSKTRTFFLLDFEAVSSSSHRWHNILGGFAAWDFLTRWKQVMSCEILWELESNFRSPKKLPLPAPPFLPPSPHQLVFERSATVWGLFVFCCCCCFCFNLCTWLRGVGLGKTLCPAFNPNSDGCGEEVPCLLSP